HLPSLRRARTGGRPLQRRAVDRQAGRGAAGPANAAGAVWPGGHHRSGRLDLEDVGHGFMKRERPVFRTTVGIAVVLIAVTRVAAGQSAPNALPAGVTRAMIAKGKELFEGTGLCFTCHGLEAKGAVGPDLTHTVWVHGHGKFEEIAALVIKGISPEESK